MRRLLSIALATLILTGSTVMAQEAESEAPPPAADPDSTAGEREQAGAAPGDKTDAPPLRDDYQPKEKISEDRAEAFPADI